jgi:TRAP-type uncharacterized transport system fused permease subunit
MTRKGKMKLIKIIILLATIGATSNVVTAANLTPNLVQCANIKSEKQDFNVLMVTLINIQQR